MPKINPIIFPQTIIHLWHITESVEELLSIFQDEMPEYISAHRNVLHQKQLLARSILQKSLSLDNILFKNEQGKPFLNNGAYISISHADKYVGIALSTQAIGIDIEKKSNKLIRIISKFLNKNEKKLIQQLDGKQLLHIWTAKESIYKLMGIKGLGFREDIEITSLDQKTGQAIVKNDTKIDLFFEDLSNEVLICQAMLQ